MIVVVTGTRLLATHPQQAEIKSYFLDTIKSLRPSVVHHGGAQGPDTWACWAFNDIQVCHRPARTDGSYLEAVDALFRRNETMIDAAGRDAILVACWDGHSRGTRQAIEYAELMDMGVVSVPVRLIERASCKTQTQ